ncbi:MAG: 4'-phosphopantetheinyl transferase superfamily protein [bacterium]|nr:4'-phosphopantetheinyl transferase superfamily protein [bacterium]
MRENLVLYTKFDDAAEEEYLAAAYRLLPADFREENERFLRAQDRRNRAAVRLLAAHGLQLLGFSARGVLQSPRKDAAGRPFLPEGGGDVNWTHAGALAAAAVSAGARVGIDAEALRELSADDYIAAFTAGEAARIRASARQSRELLRLWTRKEALLKAFGSGLLREPSAVEVLARAVSVGGRRFFIDELALEEGYTAHAASDRDVPFKVMRVEARQLFRLDARL